MTAFEWPVAAPIDLSTYPRRDLYEHFLTFEIPVVTRTLQLDVTELQAYAKGHGHRFSLTMGLVITRAVNHVPELRHRIQDGVLVEFKKVIPSFTILSEDKLLYFSKGVFTDNFGEDYAANLEILERAAKGLEQNVGSGNQGQIFITNNPWNSFTSLQFPYTSKFASVPVFGIGKMYKDGAATKAALALQSHHGLTDGYHIGHFLHHLERHLKDPSLLERPFASTFA